MIRGSVSRQHRDQPESSASCVLPDLAAEIARRAPEVRDALTTTLTELIGELAALSPADSRAAPRAEVRPLLSGMVGAVMLARAVTDPDLSGAILRPTRERLMAQLRCCEGRPR